MGQIAGILLAGGSSVRYGGNKLSQARIDGIPIGILAARHLASVVDEICVIVPPDGIATRDLFAGEFRVSICADADEGMGRSIAHGVGQFPNARGWLIALADMPCIASDTIARVAAELTVPESIARPRIGGKAGHPVGFGSAYFEELRGLQGDVGASPVLAAHPDALAYVDVDDPGILLDIDRPDDLVRVRAERA